MDNDSNYLQQDRLPPPVVEARSPADLPEIEIPTPPNGDQRSVSTPPTLPPRSPRPPLTKHELLLPRRKNRYLAKVLLFSIVGLGIGILVGVGFLLG